MLYLLTASVVGAILLFHLGTNAGLTLHVVVGAAVVFTGSFVCHGELVQSRPATVFLTRFYLLVSLGGAVGGLFAAVLSPRIFTDFLEFHISLLACLFSTGAILFWSLIGARVKSATGVYLQLLLLLLAATPVICSLVFLLDSAASEQLVFRARNDYGIVSVRDAEEYRTMYNGRTNHGGQYLVADTSRPSAYYSSGSGADVAFGASRQWKTEHGQKSELRVGVIGLGTGSLASYWSAGDRFRFYEINPLAVQAAREFFTYLSQSDSEVLIGDGRLLLERELAAGQHNGFDLLFVDAFSSDSIPIHLLTTECVELYLRHLRSDGLLVFHITNRFVDLRPVMKTLAESQGLSAVMIEHENDAFGIKTRWVLMSPVAAVLQNPSVRIRRVAWPVGRRSDLWTDDYSSLASVVIWSGGLNLKTYRRQKKVVDREETGVR